MRLVEAGYAIGPLVDAGGLAARRGGLVDVWPPGAAQPLRIEFFGSEVDSMRSFDPESQRTLERLERAYIGPASEWFADREQLAL